MREPKAQGQVKMTAAVFHLLLSLADTELHGYGLMREVAVQTAGEVRLGPGTLYTSLKRMLEAGLIEESEERPDPELDDKRRRYYRITARGRLALHGEIERLEGLVRMARVKALRAGLASK